jgi:hypothetical protein
LTFAIAFDKIAKRCVITTRVLRRHAYRLISWILMDENSFHASNNKGSALGTSINRMVLVFGMTWRTGTGSILMKAGNPWRGLCCAPGRVCVATILPGGTG